MLSDRGTVSAAALDGVGLNAPSGAGYFLISQQRSGDNVPTGLNAPSGAGCFLTLPYSIYQLLWRGLNAPSGAGGLLPRASGPVPGVHPGVLMHLLVLGAFRQYQCR